MKIILLFVVAPYCKLDLYTHVYDTLILTFLYDTSHHDSASIVRLVHTVITTRHNLDTFTSQNRHINTNLLRVA